MTLFVLYTLVLDRGHDETIIVVQQHVFVKSRPDLHVQYVYLKVMISSSSACICMRLVLLLIITIMPLIRVITIMKV